MIRRAYTGIGLMCILCCALLLAPTVYQPVLASNFFEDSKRGWFWFEQDNKPETEKHDYPKSQQERQEIDPVQSLAAFQSALEARKAAMIMTPSIENTRRYIELQNEMFLKADVVSHNWQKTLILHPELNIVKDIPISQAGLDITRQLEQQKTEKALRSFGKEFSLLFFYSSTCKYCEAFADVVEHFSKKYGYKVASVTLDGKKLKNFPGVYDHDLIQKLKVTFTPALFAFSNTKGLIVPISQGFLPIDLLERNVLMAKKIVEAKNV